MKKFTIGELCEVVKGKVSIMKAVEGEYPLVTTAEERKTHNEWHFDGKAVCVPLVSSTGHGHASIKRIHYQQGKFALGSILAAILPKDEKILDAEYLYNYLSLMKDEILVPLMKGTANVSLTIKSLKSVTILVPDLQTQLHIVKKINKISKYKLSLTRHMLNQELDIESLKKNLLQLAIQGKLVRQDPTDELASVLLEKIKREKGKVLPEIEDQEKPFDLPYGWEWVRLGSIIEYQNGFAFSSSHMDKNNMGIPVIKSNNIGSKKVVINSKTSYVSNITTKMESYYINKGDLLMVLSSQSSNVEPLGVTAMYTYDTPALLNQRVLKIKNLGINNKYLLNTINSPWFHYTLSQKAAGSAQANLRLDHVLEMLIPIPPLNEQERIAKKVDKLTNLCEELTQDVRKSMIESENLIKAALQEVFTVKEEIQS